MSTCPTPDRREEYLPDEIDAATSLTGSVGLGGRNAGPDVEQVQRLLNAVRQSEGGPVTPLKIDGVAGPRTIAAIKRFQRRQFRWADGKVDVEGPTIFRLTEPFIAKRRSN